MGKNKNKSKKSNTSNVEIQEIVETPKNLVSSKSEPIMSKAIVVESSIQEIIDESATNIDVTETNSKKNKKKCSFSDEFIKLELLKKEELEYRADKSQLIKIHDDKIKEMNSRIKKNRTEQKNIFEKLQSLHNNEIKSASKEKRKRNGENTGGFNKKQIVPKVLHDYLELTEDEPLTRPEVMHLLSEKFKKEKLKNGQQTILDKSNAKKLNKPEGYVIEFKQNQSFLAEFYNKVNIDI